MDLIIPFIGKMHLLRGEQGVCAVSILIREGEWC